MCIEFRLNIVSSLHLDGVCRFLSSRLRIRGIAQFLAFFHFRQKVGGGEVKSGEKKEEKALKLLRSFTAPPNRYHVRSIIGEKCASIIYKRVWNVFQRTRGCEMVELMHRFSSLPSTSSTTVFFDQISSRFTSVLFFLFFRCSDTFPYYYSIHYSSHTIQVLETSSDRLNCGKRIYFWLNLCNDFDPRFVMPTLAKAKLHEIFNGISSNFVAYVCLSRRGLPLRFQ